MVKFLGLYDPWGSFLDLSPSVVDLRGQGTGNRDSWAGSALPDPSGGKARVMEIPEGAKPPRTPPGGQGTGNGDSWGGKPPQTPPRHHFKKFALQGQIF